MKNTSNFGFVSKNRARGFTLLDVLLAILVFAVGMLALASLQTNLTRSSTDANTRTVATNIGEEILERLRSFRRVGSDTNPDDGVVFAFADIDEDYVEALLVNCGDKVCPGGPARGLAYSVDAEVRAFDFNVDKTAVTEAEEVVVGELHDFKLVELTISWDANQQFQIDERRDAAADAVMETGSIYIKGIISSIPSLANALVAVTDEGALGGITVAYDPFARPDTIRVNLGGEKFKESKPLVTEFGSSSDETWLEVITYNTANGDVFLRREEFLFVGCTCEFEPAQSEGLMPAIWTGTEYAIRVAAGEDGYAIDTKDLNYVQKPSGVPSGATQSPFCEICCRDHHDSVVFTEADDKFNPYLEGDEIGADGDHKHYNSALSPVGNGEYVEACRLVRKDGYMRVAQDVRQESYVALPDGYLNSQIGGDAYSAYLEQAVRGHYENGEPFQQPPDDFLGSETNPTSLPQVGVVAVGDPNKQQMQSRAIYIDHLGAEAAELAGCIYQAQQGYDPDVDVDPPGDDCGAPGVEDYLEVLPFFEIQATFLSQWKSSNPTVVFVEGVEDQWENKPVEPGLASLRSDEDTQVVLLADMTRDNTALTPVSPIRPSDSRDAGYIGDSEIYVNVNDGGEPSEPFFYSWSASANIGAVTMVASDCGAPETCNTFCNASKEGMGCSRAVGTGPGSVTLSGYGNNNAAPLYICVAVGPAEFEINNPNPASADRTATITWPNTQNLDGIVLTTQKQACP